MRIIIAAIGLMLFSQGCANTQLAEEPERYDELIVTPVDIPAVKPVLRMKSFLLQGPSVVSKTVGGPLRTNLETGEKGVLEVGDEIGDGDAIHLVRLGSKVELVDRDWTYIFEAKKKITSIEFRTVLNIQTSDP